MTTIAADFPYITFRILDNFLEELHAQTKPQLELPLPEEIEPPEDLDKNDRRLLLRALWFFDLITEERAPTDCLTAYVDTTEEEQQKWWQERVLTCYGAELVEMVRAGKRGEAKAQFAHSTLSPRLQTKGLSFLVRAIERAGWTVPPVPKQPRGSARRQAPVSPAPSGPPPVADTGRVVPMSWGSVQMNIKAGDLTPQESRQVIQLYELLLEWATEAAR